jgi:ATP-binding protein involved in chromosome partitioning
MLPDRVTELLKSVIDPNTGKDLVSMRAVKNVKVDGGNVSLDVELDYPAASQVDGIRSAVIDALKAGGAASVSANVTSRIVAHAVQRGLKVLPNVKNIVAVSSGKGGVGKSTVACNLAVGLARMGLQVGLMDADIYGPSLPIMMGVKGKPFANQDKKVIPLESHGVKCMSIGFLVDDREPIIWRGPMVMGVVKQFLQDVEWAPLDVLVIDLPPGTGDAQLTMIQAVDLAGAVVVTTPQEVAVLDAVRGTEMFKKLNVPVLGIVENMSYMELPGGGRLHPFGQGGGERTAREYEVPLLAQLPLEGSIRAGGDAGRPAALGDDGVAKVLAQMAGQVWDRLGG